MLIRKTPFVPGLQIYWDTTTESLPLHPRHLPPPPFETIEYWPLVGKSVTYRPRITKLVVGKNVQYELDYRKENHPSLKDVIWGKSVILLNTQLWSATVTWYASNRRDTGLKFPCELSDQDERARTISSPVIRNQSTLHQWLLNVDGKCAISAETTVDALECSHVVAVKNRGLEHYDNVILLRADLHRLYDSGALEISESGKVTPVSETVSDEYRRLLHEANLDKVLASRVAGALCEVGDYN